MFVIGKMTQLLNQSLVSDATYHLIYVSGALMKLLLVLIVHGNSLI